MRFLRLAFVALVVLASDVSALSATSKLQRLSARINAESQRQHALAETQIYTENQDKGGNGLLTTGWVKVDDLVDINQIRKKTTGGLLETEAQHKQTETETETDDDENSPHVLLETERLMSQLSSLETALAQAKQQQQQQQQQQQRGPVLMETHEDDDEEDSMIERLSTQLSHLESALAQHQQQQQRGPVLMEQEPNNDDIDVESMIGHIEDQLGSLERELEQHQGPPPGRAGDSTNDHRITDPFNDPLTNMESDLPEFELMEISQQQQHEEEMMQQLESRVEALARRLNTQHLTSDDDDDTELLEVSDARCPGYPPQYHYITKIGTTVINKCYDCSTYGYNWIWDGRTSCVHSGRFGW